MVFLWHLAAVFSEYIDNIHKSTFSTFQDYNITGCTTRDQSQQFNSESVKMLLSSLKTSATLESYGSSTRTKKKKQEMPIDAWLRWQKRQKKEGKDMGKTDRTGESGRFFFTSWSTSWQMWKTMMMMTFIEYKRLLFIQTWPRFFFQNMLR